MSQRYLDEISGKNCAYLDEEEDYNPDDYAGGNIDDAFSNGIDAGYIMLARELVSKFYKASN